MRPIAKSPLTMGAARSGLAELGRAYERSVYDAEDPAALL
jgi:hypothetical protein